MSKIKLSAAQALAIRDAEIIGTSYVVKAKTQTANALRRLGMIRETSTQLTVAGAVARMTLQAMSVHNGASVYPYDLGDAEELFVIPSVSDVPSDVRADWEREQEANVIVDAPYWASNGPLLETLDSVPSECYWGCGEPVVAVWFDSVGNVEGACATHLTEIQVNGYHATMLPVAEHVEAAPVADYVITHNPDHFRGVVGIGAFDGLKRHTEKDARDLLARSARASKSARMFRVSTLEDVTEATGAPVVDVLADAIAHMPTPFVGIAQGLDGFVHVEHIHTEGCRDIAREMKRWGKSERYDYPGDMTIADIVSANWADVASDEYGNDVMTSADAWRDMVTWCQDSDRGIKIMACAKDIIGGTCPAGDVYRTSAGFPAISPRTGVVNCTECGEHIMSDDMSMPAQCEGGCDAGEADMSAVADALPSVADLIPTTGTVYSAIIDSHAPNGTAWTTDMRTMTEWTPFPGSDLDAIGQIRAMVTNNACDAVGWLLSDGTAVVSVTIRGKITTAYMITPDDVADTRSADDMADTMDAPVTVDAHLIITVSEGVTVDLGWHTFTIPVGCEKSIPTLYGERNGEWRTGTADWDSIIRVMESYTE